MTSSRNTRRAITLCVLFFLALSLTFQAEKAEAQSVEELQAQVATLLAQLQILQAQVSGQGTPVAVCSLARNLRLGSGGADVNCLQRLLNGDPQTQVASFGPGSPGQETNFFGPATLSAVKKFQQKYTSEILLPVGLTSPSGFVGPSTRTKLGSLSGSVPSQPSQPFGPSTPSQPSLPLSFETFQKDNYQTQEGFYVRAPSQYDVAPGQNVWVYGGGFTSDTKVALGQSILPQPVNVQPKTPISSLPGLPGAVTLPVAEDIAIIQIPSSFPAGIHELIFIKGNVRSKPSTKVLVKKPGAQRPVITGINQTDSHVLISGINLTDSNTIQTSQGKFPSLPAQNNVISIPKWQLVGEFGGRDFSGKLSNIYFSVINDNGISEQIPQTLNFVAAPLIITLP
jgi:peptidoglycan hydrolase-like protein with peptidoglycan-binding domain